MSAEPVAWLEFADHDIINAISPARRRKWIEADPINQAAAKAYPVAAYAHPDPRIAALEGLLREALVDLVHISAHSPIDTYHLCKRIEAALKGEK